VSRVERRIPPPPSIGQAVRDAATDLYYNSWRFLPANFIFGVILIALFGAVAATGWGWIVAIALIPPAAGCMAMATSLVRVGHTDFGEFLGVLRRPWRPLAIGIAQLGALLVLVVDVLIGAAWQSVVGGVLAVSAIYGIGIGWAYCVVAWPIVLDPVRASEPIARRLGLAFRLLLGHPFRVGGLALLIGAFLVASTVAVAAIVTVALAFAFLVTARYVLPAADRLEGRPTIEVEV
jgi:hypothetical protein